MALVVQLKSVDNLRGKADRLAKVTFRGVTNQTKIITRCKQTAFFNQSLEWPIARDIEEDERVSIQILNHKKYLSDKPVGYYELSLQEIINNGELTVDEPLLDNNNRLMESTINFDVRYFSPDGRVGNWAEGEIIAGDEADGFSDTASIASSRTSGLSSSRRSLPLALRETQTLRIQKVGPDFVQPGDEYLDGGIDDNTSNQIMTDTMYTDKSLQIAKLYARRTDFLEQEFHKPKDFQIAVTIIEAQQLHGLNNDPVIRIEVGNDHRYTTIKQSTNCPFYNENFSFDYCESPAMIFDKMITLTAYHSYGIPGRDVLKVGNLVAGKKIGTFRCDVGTVYSSPDHQYYHKWAALLDETDLADGPKGYIKCNMSVTGKGDLLRAPKGITEEDSNNIEGNLLLPAGISMQRQNAIYQFSIFRAEDLPRTDFGIVASLRNAINSKNKFLDAFVKISFLGHVGKTSVKKDYNPEWKEILSFSDMFPPLCNRIKVQLCDRDAVKDDVIGTHFIDLSAIMDPGGETEGMLPQFGPSWINFYGSPRHFELRWQDSEDLNNGLGEGSAFRGRLLMKITTTLVDPSNAGKAGVRRERLLRTGGASDFQPRTAFLLFGAFFEATMIDKSHKDKPVYFEMSIGQFGNKLDAKAARAFLDLSTKGDSDDDDEEMQIHTSMRSKRKIEEGELIGNSTTEVTIPSPSPDKNYYHMPWGERKPCLYTEALFEDTRKRLFHTNILKSIIEKLDEGVEDVRHMLRDSHPYPHRRLRGVLDILQQCCENYICQQASLASGVGAGKTKLDMHRFSTIKNSMDKMKQQAQQIKKKVNFENVKEKYKDVRQMVTKLKRLSRDPQSSLPDVFIWMVVNNKRIAYHRIPAKDILEASIEDYQGKKCKKVQTIFLRKPGKKGLGSSGWAMQAKLRVALWLGERVKKKGKEPYMDEVPEGYKTERKSREEPPRFLIYDEKSTYQLRAHLFQARSLIGSDYSGLSDPFARVIVADQCKATKVIKETLSPIWDESLVFRNITLYGSPEVIAASPPYIVVEFYDYDAVGEPEFIGRSMIQPSVKLIDDTYELPRWPPQLAWHDIYRGSKKSGELLAVLELLEGEKESDLPRLPPIIPPPSEKEAKNWPEMFRIPPAIKPTVSKFRVEFLFWGLRDLQRLQFTKVEKPQMTIECAGHSISSRRIENIEKNSNFEDNLRYMDIELPDNEMYWPPLTIRCMDFRNFGREVLVGVHTIDHLTDYIYQSPVEKARLAEEKRLKLIAQRDNTGELDPILPLEDEAMAPGQNGSVAIDMPDVQIAQPNDAVKPDHVAISIPNGSAPGSKAMPAVSAPRKEATKLAADSKKYPNQPTAEAVADDLAKARRDYQEKIKDLDWWSKFYAVKEDEARKEQDDAIVVGEQTGDSSSIGGDDVSFYEGYGLDVIDYSDLNEKKMKELEKLAAKQREAETGKKVKKKWFKGTKKRMARLKGHANKAFAGDEKIYGSEKGDDDDEFTFNDEEDKKDRKEHITRFTLYEKDLEKVNEFGGFEELLHTYPLYRGKKTNDDEEDSQRVVGRFKGTLTLYKLQESEIQDQTNDKSSNGSVHSSDSAGKRSSKLSKRHGSTLDLNQNKTNVKLRLIDGLPSHKPYEVHVRVYVVRATDLHPEDLNGKSDPYLVLKCGRESINEKDNKFLNTLNPVFGKMFEFDVAFPVDSILKIKVMDYDKFSLDDLIGETEIDLENRFQSRHRPRCGIQQKYELFGFNTWRDPMKPTAIVDRLCKESKLEMPEYKQGSVYIGGRHYYADSEIFDEAGEKTNCNDLLALEVLKHWDEVPNGCKLVPEHVESRSLYNADRPGIEQGKLDMWIDMFPKDMPMPSVTVDITPREPKGYELRCTIWNTDDVVLEDKNILTGEMSSDIFVKGYVLGVQEDGQSTDVHYRSLTGEGNFNWRYVFPFQYLSAEEKVVFKKKSGVFDLDDSEIRLPAKLTLQVWDADLVSSDDYLGAVTLNLNAIPKPAKNPKYCSLKMLKTDGSVPTLNLFKNKRCKGWWPLFRKTDEGIELVGKVEAELSLVTAEEAERSPVGLARDDPEKLEYPNRPDTSFLWFLNPLKTLRYILWRNFKWKLLKLLIFLLFACLIGLFLYSFPGATVNAIFGA